MAARRQPQPGPVDALVTAALTREAVASTALDRDQTHVLDAPTETPAPKHLESADGRCWHPKCRGQSWPCVPALSLGIA